MSGKPGSSKKSDSKTQSKGATKSVSRGKTAAKSNKMKKNAENLQPRKSGGSKKNGKKKQKCDKNAEALYDAKGIHISSGKDICDCLLPGCVGCFYPCEKCGSPRCGLECRCNRDFVYDDVTYDAKNYMRFNDLV